VKTRRNPLTPFEKGGKAATKVEFPLFQRGLGGFFGFSHGLRSVGTRRKNVER